MRRPRRSNRKGLCKRWRTRTITGVGIAIVVLVSLVFLWLLRGRSNHEEWETIDWDEVSFRIPRVCHQTFPTQRLPPALEENLKANKARNPDIEFKLYDDAMIEHFLAHQYGRAVVDAYHRINPKFGAARADFFRYFLVYKVGGIYLDIKSDLKEKFFGHYIKPDDRAVLDVVRRDNEAWRWRYPTHEQWMLIYEPHHPYLKYMLERLLRDFGPTPPPAMIMYRSSASDKKDVAKEFVTPGKQKVLRSTGPDAYGVALHDAMITEGIMHRITDFDSIAHFISPIMKLRGGRSRKYYTSGHVHYSKLREQIYMRLPSDRSDAATEDSLRQLGMLGDV